MNDLERERAFRRLAELAAHNPRVMEHLDDEGTDTPDQETDDMAKKPPPPAAVRISSEFADRADALIEALADDPRLRAHGYRSRAGVLRLAMALGLEQLEAEIAEGEHLREAGPEVLARVVAPYVIAVLREIDQANERLGTLGHVEPRPGSRPPWAALAHGGLVLGVGHTPLEAAEAALSRWG